ncbi:hypothetical protein V8C86DRAFT_3136348 [Haematococcus lacustris]
MVPIYIASVMTACSLVVGIAGFLELRLILGPLGPCRTWWPHNLACLLLWLPLLVLTLVAQHSPDSLHESSTHLSSSNSSSSSGVAGVGAEQLGSHQPTSPGRSEGGSHLGSRPHASLASKLGGAFVLRLVLVLAYVCIAGHVALLLAYWWRWWVRRRQAQLLLGEAQRKLAAGQRLGQGHDLDLHLLGGWVPGGGRQRAAAATAAGGEGWGQGSWSAPAPCLAPGGHQFSLQSVGISPSTPTPEHPHTSSSSGSSGSASPELWAAPPYPHHPPGHPPQEPSAVGGAWGLGGGRGGGAHAGAARPMLSHPTDTPVFQLQYGGSQGAWGVTLLIPAEQEEQQLALAIAQQLAPQRGVGRRERSRTSSGSGEPPGRVGGRGERAEGGQQGWGEGEGGRRGLVDRVLHALRRRWRRAVGRGRGSGRQQLQELHPVQQQQQQQERAGYTAPQPVSALPQGHGGEGSGSSSSQGDTEELLGRRPHSVMAGCWGLSAVGPPPASSSPLSQHSSPASSWQQGQQPASKRAWQQQQDPGWGSDGTSLLLPSAQLSSDPVSSSSRGYRPGAGPGLLPPRTPPGSGPMQLISESNSSGGVLGSAAPGGRRGRARQRRRSKTGWGREGRLGRSHQRSLLGGEQGEGAGGYAGLDKISEGGSEGEEEGPGPGSPHRAGEGPAASLLAARGGGRGHEASRGPEPLGGLVVVAACERQLSGGAGQAAGAAYFGNQPEGQGKRQLGSDVGQGQGQGPPQLGQVSLSTVAPSIGAAVEACLPDAPLGTPACLSLPPAPLAPALASVPLPPLDLTPALCPPGGPPRPAPEPVAPAGSSYLAAADPSQSAAGAVGKEGSHTHSHAHAPHPAKPQQQQQQQLAAPRPPPPSPCHSCDAEPGSDHTLLLAGLQRSSSCSAQGSSRRPDLLRSSYRRSKRHKQEGEAAWPSYPSAQPSTSPTQLLPAHTARASSADCAVSLPPAAAALCAPHPPPPSTPTPASPSNSSAIAPLARTPPLTPVDPPPPAASLFARLTSASDAYITRCPSASSTATSTSPDPATLAPRAGSGGASSGAQWQRLGPGGGSLGGAGGGGGGGGGVGAQALALLRGGWARIGSGPPMLPPPAPGPAGSEGPAPRASPWVRQLQRGSHARSHSSPVDLTSPQLTQALLDEWHGGEAPGGAPGQAPRHNSFDLRLRAGQ